MTQAYGHFRTSCHSPLYTPTAEHHLLRAFVTLAAVSACQVWINRSVMLQPANSDPAVALARSVLHQQQMQQRMAVASWVASQEAPEGVGPEITAPLLAGALGAAAADAAAAEEDDLERAMFVSASSKQASLGSLVSASSQPQEL